jgi:Na+-transporting NADH:ubiquinone oxidoreductase subunit C
MKEIKTYLFVIVMCSASAFILSIIGGYLQEPQIKARNAYRSKELLTAAHLVPKNANNKMVETIMVEKITPMLTNDGGESFTFEEKKIDYATYFDKGIKTGYSKKELKLYYQIKNGGIILPVNGMGLWDAIYGYIGVEKNGYRILGITWYDQKETPGLGAQIENSTWQDTFIGKTLFHGKKMDQFGLDFIPKEMIMLLSPSKQEYSIDAISGATLTTQGVQNAIKNSLSPYIPLLRKMQKK